MVQCHTKGMAIIADKIEAKKASNTIIIAKDAIYHTMNGCNFTIDAI
jgi:hypothetical protein